MIRREDGAAYLPSQSVRGSFRAHARRVWQTLAWDKPQDVARTTSVNAAKNGDQSRLAGFLRMFGATGWRSPIEVSEFTLLTAEVPYTQEFVAVDRFTGGAADKKIFNAHGLWKPSFAGVFTITTGRWENAGVQAWAWLLMAFVFRDWMEGDGYLGFGRSKGYGSFTAAIKVEGVNADAMLLSRILQRDAAALNSPELEKWDQSLNAILEEAA